MSTGADVDGEYRTRLFHAIRDLTADAYGGWQPVTNVQAGGGLYAQRIVTRKHYDLDARQAGRAAGRGPGRRHGAEPWRLTGKPDHVDFEIPGTTKDLLTALDSFIEREIQPLEEEDDNRRFFDHRREWARTDFERGRGPRAGVGGAARRDARAAPTRPGFYRLRPAGGAGRPRRHEPRRWP